jgi:hypothetical protein
LEATTEKNGMNCVVIVGFMVIPSSFASGDHLFARFRKVLHTDAVSYSSLFHIYFNRGGGKKNSSEKILHLLFKAQRHPGYHL